MARDGSGVYSRPANTTAVTGQTITATLWETMMLDLIGDANTDRPVAAGGTGASTAADARANLGAAADADVVKLTGAQTVAGVKTFSSSATISASFARLNIVGTDLTSGSRAFGVGGIADGTFVILALNDDLTSKEELARFEPAGTSISDAQATVTREKGDARYGRINTKTSATETTFEVGQMLLCIMDSTPGAVPALNDTLGVRLDNSRYKVAGSTGTSLTGTWRVCGWLATGEANVGVMMQRVA